MKSKTRHKKRSIQKLIIFAAVSLAITPAVLSAPVLSGMAAADSLPAGVKPSLSQAVANQLGGGSLSVGESITIDMKNTSEGADGYTYAIVTQNPNVANVTLLNGTKLYIGGRKTGTTMVYLNVRNGDNQPIQHEGFRLNVKANDSLDQNQNGIHIDDIVRYTHANPDLGKPDVRTLLSTLIANTSNKGPEAASPLNLTVELNGQAIVDLNEYFSDADGDPLHYSVQFPRDSFASATLDDAGGILTISGNQYSAEPLSFTVTASDGQSGNAPAVLQFAVNMLNHEPSVTPIAKQEMDEDTTLTGNAAASDIDGDPVTFNMQASGALHGTAVVDPVSGAYTYTPMPNYYGTDSFTILAADSHGAVSPVMVPITVNPVDDAPVLNQNKRGGYGNNGDFKLIEGQTLTIDLNDMFTNIDDETPLTFAVVPGGTLADFTYSLTGSVLVINAANFSEALEAASFDISASDGNDTTHNAITVQVVDSGYNAIPDQSIESNSTSHIPLDQYFSFSSGNDWTGSVTMISGGEYLRSAAISATASGADLVLEGADTAGTAVVAVRIQDGHGGRISEDVTVYSGNGIVVHDIGMKYWNGYSFDVDLSDIFSGADVYTITSKGYGVYPRDASGSDLSIGTPFTNPNIHVDMDGGDFGTLIIQASNENVTATYYLEYGTNEGPVQNDLFYSNNPIILRAGDHQDLDAAQLFTDTEGDPLSFMTESVDPSIASISEAVDNKITVTGVTYGDTAVTIYVHDAVSDGDSSGQLNVHVVDAGTEIARFGMLQQDNSGIDISSYLSRLNGVVTPMISSVSSLIGSVSIDGSHLVLHANDNYFSGGNETVTVRLADEDANTEDVTITIYVYIPPGLV